VDLSSVSLPPVLPQAARGCGRITISVLSFGKVLRPEDAD
jgi:hypothetical protein